MSKNGAMPISQNQNVKNKILVRDAMESICSADSKTVEAAIEGAYSPDAKWRGSHPLNETCGHEAMAKIAWAPLMTAFPDMERRDEIIAGGRYMNKQGVETDLVACMGHYCGTFKRDWLDIPATGQPVFLRYGEVHQVANGKIVQSTCLWDVLDLIRQAGFWPLAPSWGMEGRWAGPLTCDGLLISEQNMDEGMASLAQTLAMHKTLHEYRKEDIEGRNGLINMPQKDHWHEKMMWYGPSGIGTTRGLEGFVDFHQLPFRLAFPGRTGGQALVDSNPDAGVGHYIQIGDGPYSVTGGWPSVVSPHTGGDLLGSGPTGLSVEMRVMDFYLHHEGRIRENWVPIDVIHILLQLGVDVMARMRDQFSRHRLGLR